MSAGHVVGVDGCTGGWIAVTLTGGAVERVDVVDHIGHVLAEGPAAVAIDMPVGAVHGGPRDADVAARRALPGRAASVFAAPPRAVVDLVARRPETTHAEATALAVQIDGRGVSQQAFRLLPRIVEVDQAVADGADVHEVHPEVAFATLAGQVLPRKRSWAGVAARRRLLAARGLELPDDFPGADRCGPDDVLDAAVCAWVADAIATDGPLVRLPEQPSQHDRGRPIVIVARRPVA